MHSYSKGKAMEKQGRVLLKAGFLSVLLILVAVLGTVSAAGGSYEITRYDIRMEVATDNSYRITETLDVHFFQEQHGIYRDIPTVTYNGYSAFVKDIRIDGDPYEISREGQNLRIRIGDPDRYAPQDKRYILSYRFIIGDDRLKDMDEVYYNLIGTGWDANIRGATFSVSMPKSFDSSVLNFTSGSEGSADNTAVSYQVNGTEIQGTLQRALAPHEALTMALPLPEGYFTEAVLEETTLEKLLKLWWVLMGIPVLGGTLLWTFFGKNRRIFPAVEFYPPVELNPAEAGYVFDGQVNPYDISSLIIYWADKGYLTILDKEEEKGRLFRRKKQVLYLEKVRDIQDAPPHEMQMFTALFTEYAQGDVVCVADLEESFYVRANAVEAQLKKDMGSGEKGPVFQPMGWAVVLMIQLLAILCAAMTVLLPLGAFNGYFGLLHVVFSLMGGFFAAFPIWNFTKVIHDWNKILPGRRGGRLFLALLGMVILLGASGFIAWETDRIPQITLGLCAVFLLYLMAADSVKRSAKGDDYTARIMGFRDFILYAEKDRIEALVEENPSYFYNVLPYAMVLGITDKWARKFEGIALAPPDWYRTDSRRYSTFNASVFSATINSNMMTMAGSMKSAPNSSGSGGSSGGGSSGGGSGGGGGGSW